LMVDLLIPHTVVLFFLLTEAMLDHGTKNSTAA
jgi:hypothetical protein